MRPNPTQIGELIAKSRRGSLKLRFDLPVLVAVDKREFWYPPQALVLVAPGEEGADAAAAERRALEMAAPQAAAV